MGLLFDLLICQMGISGSSPFQDGFPPPALKRLCLTASMSKVEAGGARSPSSSARGARFENGISERVNIIVVKLALVQRSSSSPWPARGAGSSRGVQPARHRLHGGAQLLQGQPQRLRCAWDAGLGSGRARMSWEWAGWAVVAVMLVSCTTVSVRKGGSVAHGRAMCRSGVKPGGGLEPSRP